MALQATHLIDERVALADEMDPKDLSALLTVIDASDAAHARGEALPAAVLLQDIRRIYAER